ncbi:MAG: hypothetical protein WBF54_02025 [Terriglobales bacterium]
MEDSQKNERKTDRQGRNTSPANEGLADEGSLPVGREGPSCMEVPQELLFLGPGASFARPKGWAARVRRLSMRADMDNPDTPLAIAVLPSPEERKRRERVLARLLVIALDPLLSEGHTDLSVKIETAQDLIRELKFVYPETMAI